MLPPPYPVLIYLMAASFFLGMYTYRVIHIIVRRHTDKKYGISRGTIK